MKTRNFSHAGVEWKWHAIKSTDAGVFRRRDIALINTISPAGGPDAKEKRMCNKFSTSIYKNELRTRVEIRNSRQTYCSVQKWIRIERDYDIVPRWRRICWLHSRVQCIYSQSECRYYELEAFTHMTFSIQSSRESLFELQERKMVEVVEKKSKCHKALRCTSVKRNKDWGLRV